MFLSRIQLGKKQTNKKTPGLHEDIHELHLHSQYRLLRLYDQCCTDPRVLVKALCV